MILDLKQQPVSDLTALLALNNAFKVETSELDTGGLRAMLEAAFAAAAIGDGEAMLIAFDQAGRYASPNFRWFCARFPRFVYVDRIIVSAAAQGRGDAHALYQWLFAKARDAGHDMVVCEVNSDPPNPRSEAFHARLGFAQVGAATLANGKSVRYLARPL